MLVTLPTEKNLGLQIGTIKQRANRTVEKYSIRLVAKGSEVFCSYDRQTVCLLSNATNLG